MAVTPFMQQYLELKQQYPSNILFFRLGDFYEMFYEDAKTVSKELDLVLTGKDCGLEERAPMCGIPFHSCEGYIAKLVERGYTVAICEQMEDPATAKGLVRREVTRIITPGTLIESSMLDETANNYLCAVCRDDGGIGCAFADISTGTIYATEAEGADSEAYLCNEIGAYRPKECILSCPKEDLSSVSVLLTDRLNCMISEENSFRFDESVSHPLFRSHFPESGQSASGEARLISSVGALLSYLEETQKTDLSSLRKLHVYRGGRYMEIDVSTRRNLELCETMRSKEKKGTLLWVLDRTKTAMGARMLRKWIEQPLIDPKAILFRQGAVRDLYGSLREREEMALLLRDVLDLERLITRVVYNTAGPKDVRAICNTLSVLPSLRAFLKGFGSPALSALYADLDELTDLREQIDRTICEDPPFSSREGGFIRDGFHEDVDRLRSILNDGHSWKEEIEQKERDATGIPKLKIGYNKVFGYYLEVTNSYLNLVPDRWIRKQTLTGAERYITEELKNMESSILGAKDKLYALEYDLFQQLRGVLAENVARIQKTAVCLAQLDTYLSLAEVAVRNGYTCPDIDEGDRIEIRDGRHPVVERFSGDSFFVPNDTSLDCDTRRMMLITGPNMAGKSTYMRQVALICIMAQIGSFVPAKDARIGVLDRVFTRVGASDDLASGQSTFMLEMTEVASILKHATAKSLIVFDEIGRGTSTYDGMAIARAVLEYTLSPKVGAKTMFATHYHELTEIESQTGGVINYHIAAKKRGDDIIFLRKIIPGPTDESYGVEVAKLAGIPSEVIQRAKKILSLLNEGKAVDVRQKKKITPIDEDQFSLDIDAASESFESSEIRRRLTELDINTMTPISALTFLSELKKIVE
ncbi:MAG: DNA mismatch repair protein MutS [Clostridia bacterium]|nr:DNA mismatch repair protein MutS [Clostridia bacterium]